MDGCNFEKESKQSLLDDDFCISTTEKDDEEFIPYSLHLLLEQRKRERTLKISKLHEDNGNNNHFSGQ